MIFIDDIKGTMSWSSIIHKYKDKRNSKNVMYALYRHRCYLVHYIHCPRGDRDKDKVPERPSICHIFGKQWVQGYQIYITLWASNQYRGGYTRVSISCSQTYRVSFLTGHTPKSSKYCGWQNPYQKSESGPIQQQDVKFESYFHFLWGGTSQKKTPCIYIEFAFNFFSSFHYFWSTYIIQLQNWFSNHLPLTIMVFFWVGLPVASSCLITCMKLFWVRGETGCCTHLCGCTVMSASWLL